MSYKIVNQIDLRAWLLALRAMTQGERERSLRERIDIFCSNEAFRRRILAIENPKIPDDYSPRK